MLRDSEMKGQRYVNEKTRRADKSAQDRAEFLKELEQIRTGGKPSRDAVTGTGEAGSRGRNLGLREDLV